MAEKMNGLSRDLIIHPGETLKEVIDDRNITQKELAKRIGFSVQHVSRVINGAQDISTQFAKALEYVLGISASFWINLQKNYDLELMEYEERNHISNEELACLKELKPITPYLQSKNIIPNTCHKVDMVIALRRFLGINNLTLIPSLQFCAAYRASPKTSINVYVLYAWHKLCDILAEANGDVGKLNKKTLKESIQDIKIIMNTPDEHIPLRLTEIFKKCGISFCMVNHFKGAPVNGFIRRLSSGQVNLCMTIRQSRADIFWFTLFHEIAHILYDDFTHTLVDYAFEKNAEENTADEFAKNTLIKNGAYDSFTRMKNFTLPEIQNFAQLQNVPPYIVIGRLQKEGYLPWNAYQREILKFKWAEDIQETGTKGKRI